MGLEIERKFLLEKYPERELEQGHLIVVARLFFEQTYLALTDQQELRVRKILEEKNGQQSKSFTHTFKAGQGLTRQEIEYEISEEIYEQLIIGKQPLRKVRTQVQYGETILEIDDYTGFNMLTVEVEFSSVEQATAFVPPAWFGKEVGSIEEYRNKTLWASLQNIQQEKR